MVNHLMKSWIVRVGLASFLAIDLLPLGPFAIASAETLTRRSNQATQQSLPVRKSLGLLPGQRALPQDKPVRLPKICKDCSGDAAFAGHPSDSSPLVHVIGRSLRRSTDGGKSWTDEDFDPTNTSSTEALSGLEPQLVTLNDGSFVFSTLATLDDPRGRNPKFGGALYAFTPPNILDPRNFQDLPEGDTHDVQFAFVDRPRLALNALNDLSSSTIYIAGTRVWFEDTRSSDLGLYVITALGEADEDVSKHRIQLPGVSPNALSAIESIAVDTSSPQKTLYAAVVTAQPGSAVGSPVAVKLLRFTSATHDGIPFDTFPVTSIVPRFVFPRVSTQIGRAWLVNTGPILAVDTNATSRFRGRLYLAWAQEREVRRDASFEPMEPFGGSYGYDYDVYVTSSDNGQQWSPAVKVNDDIGGTGNSVSPWIEIGPDGTLHIAFFHQEDPEHPLFDTYYARSTDGGAHFSKNVRVSEDSMAIPLNDDLGDPIDLLATPRADHVLIDYPCGNPRTPPTDMCLAKVEFTPPGPSSGSNQAPKLSAISNQTIREDTELKFTAIATDGNGDPITYELIDTTLPIGQGPDQAFLDPKTGVFKWKPARSIVPPAELKKDYQVTIKATDQPLSGTPLSGTKTFTITVTNDNLPPVMGVIPPQTVNEGQALSFPILATDPDGSSSTSLTYSIAASDPPLPKEAILDPKTGVFTWTPSFAQVQQGTQELRVTFKATEHLGSSSQETPKSAEGQTTITVRHVSRAPTITLTPNVTEHKVKAGQKVKFTASAIQEGAPVQFSLFPAREKGEETLAVEEVLRRRGVVWNATTNTFEWILEESDVRDRPYEFTIYAVDPSGGSASGTSSSISQVTISITVSTGNLPPTVQFVSPLPGTRVLDPSRAEVKVKAVDPNGRIAKVELFRGSLLLGQGTLVDPANSIYSFSVSLPAGGPYVLTAKATDDHLPQGATAEASIQLSANLLPSVTLTQPSNGSKWTASAAGILLIATASDSDGSINQVEFYRKASPNPERIGVATKPSIPSGSSYQVDWTNVPAGNHELYAVATDGEGAKATSPLASITADPAPDNFPPSVAWDSPADGATFVAPAKQIELKARASDQDGTIDKVEFLDSNSKVIGTVSKPSSAVVSVVWENVPAGKYTVTVRATDNKGANVISSPLTIEVTNPVINQVSNKAPVVHTLTATPTTVTLSLLPPREATVKVEADVDDVDKLPNPPGALTYSWSWKKVSGPPEGDVVFNTPKAPKTNATFTGIGVYELELTASDGALSASKKVTVTVTAPPPTGYELSLPGVPLKQGTQIPLLPAGRPIKVKWSIPTTHTQPGSFNGLLIGLYLKGATRPLSPLTYGYVLPQGNQQTGESIIPLNDRIAPGDYELRFSRGANFKQVEFVLPVEVVKDPSPPPPPDTTGTGTPPTSSSSFTGGFITTKPRR